MTQPLSDIAALLKLAVETAKIAGAHLGGAKHSEIETLLARDVKIRADRELHELIVKRLRAHSAFPVLSEEDASNDAQNLLKTGTAWIVDPIDGSVNFSRGLPLSCISIGLWHDGMPALGVILDFHRQEIFAGAPSIGLTLNDQALPPQASPEMKDAICLTGFPVATDFDTQSLNTFVTRLQAFKKVRLLGSAALSLAYVASGRADYYTEKDIAVWDVAAGLALVLAGGGKMRLSPSNKPLRFEVQAGCVRLVDQLS